MARQTESYINKLLDLKPQKTDGLYNELAAKGHPVIRRDVAMFLSQVITLSEPEKILEIGTNAGYSAIVMAKAMKKGKIYTIDYRADNHQSAAENFKKFGVEDKISLLTGYGNDIIKELNENFDLIFIDADKKGYGAYLDYAACHLNPKGVIIADNLFWKGAVISEEAGDDPRGVTSSLREFNKKFASLKGFKTQILSIGDGLGFAVKEDR
ncbi:MAG TPA: O-methyltransferase [Clostridiales bacterium]|nr:O-methyltransferase [Clostridiales bacterium]HQP68860.1 O-methyltransferase [Clostridiales bacterium]